jgi:hypothetical protein
VWVDLGSGIQNVGTVVVAEGKVHTVICNALLANCTLP